MSIKIPMTPAGIEPATLRFVAQHLHRSVNEILVNNVTEVPESYEVLKCLV